jgi:hypothetical protein
MDKHEGGSAMSRWEKDVCLELIKKSTKIVGQDNVIVRSRDLPDMKLEYPTLVFLKFHFACFVCIFLVFIKKPH